MADDHVRQFANEDRRIVDRRDHDVLDVLELLHLDHDGVFNKGGIEGIGAAAQQADRPHVVGLGTEREHVAADVGIGLLDGVLDLPECDAIPIELARIDEHLILLDRAAEAGDVDHARHLFEHAVEHPVLHRLDLAERVARPLQHVADDFAGGTPRRKLRRDAFGQIHRGDAVEHLLPRGREVCPVGESALDVVEARDRGAAKIDQPWHAVERGLERNTDEPFHLLGARARILREHFHQRRGGIGVGFHVELRCRVEADGDQRHRAKQHQRPVLQTPGDDGADHGDAGRGTAAAWAAGWSGADFSRLASTRLGPADSIS